MTESVREQELLDRLYDLLVAAHSKFGQTIERIDPVAHPDLEVYPCGETGVIAFVGDYVISGWADWEQWDAKKDAYARLWERLLERGYTLHMVHPMNFRSVKLTRRLGAKPVGVDADGYLHYKLILQDFEAHVPALRHRRGQENGQENATA